VDLVSYDRPSTKKHPLDILEREAKDRAAKARDTNITYQHSLAEAASKCSHPAWRSQQKDHERGSPLNLKELVVSRADEIWPVAQGLPIDQNSR